MCNSAHEVKSLENPGPGDCIGRRVKIKSVRSLIGTVGSPESSIYGAPYKGSGSKVLFPNPKQCQKQAQCSLQHDIEGHILEAVSNVFFRECAIIF